MEYKWKISISIACIFLGLFAVLQYKTQKSQGFPVYSQQTTELIKIMKDLEQERNKLRAELSKTREQLEEFEAAAGNQEASLKVMKKQLEEIRMGSGYAPVQGPGLTIQLSDSFRGPKPNEDPYYYTVHDVDLQAVINELWASGAEAISINEQRIVTNTSIRCAGPTILVNTERLVPPYIVKAIGPTTTMESSLRMPGGFMDSMSPNVVNGVDVKINREENIVVPAFNGTYIFRYAKLASNNPSKTEETK